MFTSCFCTQFRRTSGALTKIYDEALQPSGLRITQFSLLRSLSRLETSTLTELADESALDLTTISRNVKVLIENGWVSVSKGQEDKRHKTLRLTTKGRAKIGKAMPFFETIQKEIEKHMREQLQAPAPARLLNALEALQTFGNVDRPAIQTDKRT